jgi:hypothetical protein
VPAGRSAGGELKLTNMTALKETAASLRFFGEDLDPEVISDALGRKPEAYEIAGVPIQTSSGATRIPKRGSWRCRAARCQPGNLDSQIDELLSGTTQDLMIWRELTSRYTADFFCGLFLKEENEGLPISAETIRKLAERGLKLDLDIYGPESHEV